MNKVLLYDMLLLYSSSNKSRPMVTIQRCMHGDGAIMKAEIDTNNLRYVVALVSNKTESYARSLEIALFIQTEVFMTSEA